jgi:hypothetical protein
MTLFNGRIRRPVLALVLALGLLVGFITLVSISQSSTQIDQLYDESQGPVSAHGWANLESDPSLYATTPAIPASPYDKVVMSELGNATIRAELGRASWRLLHTMAARYPKRPTLDEQNALRSFIYLFARLYPCGQCARHFQIFLRENPPQVGSRDEVTQWACHVHNLVNKRLNKPIFDCSRVQEEWKCGCEDAEDETDTET